MHYLIPYGIGIRMAEMRTMHTIVRHLKIARGIAQQQRHASSHAFDSRNAKPFVMRCAEKQIVVAEVVSHISVRDITRNGHTVADTQLLHQYVQSLQIHPVTPNIQMNITAYLRRQLAECLHDQILRLDLEQYAPHSYYPVGIGFIDGFALEGVDVHTVIADDTIIVARLLLESFEHALRDGYISVHCR